MFGSKKIPAAPAPSEQHQKLNDTLDEIDRNLSEALKEMRRRLAEKERRLMAVAQ